MSKIKKLGREVAIVGAGMSKFGAFPDKTTRDLFVEAFNEMTKSVDRGFDPKEIEALILGIFPVIFLKANVIRRPLWRTGWDKFPNRPRGLKTRAAAGE